MAEEAAAAGRQAEAEEAVKVVGVTPLLDLAVVTLDLVAVDTAEEAAAEAEEVAAEAKPQFI